MFGRRGRQCCFLIEVEEGGWKEEVVPDERMARGEK